MFDGLVVQSASGRYDDDARARIDGERAVAVAVGDLEQQTRDGSAFHLDNKSPAGGVLEDVGRVFALREPKQQISMSYFMNILLKCLLKFKEFL